MKLAYDSGTDSLYIALAERPSVDSEEIRPGFILDFDADGALVGIDIDHASRRLDLQSLDAESVPFQFVRVRPA